MALKKKITPATPANPTFDLHRTLPNPMYGGATIAPALAPKRDWKKIFKRLTTTLVILLLIGGGFMGWKLYSNSSKIFGGNIFGLLQSTKLKGEDVGRVNILLIGNSADDPNHGGAELTDSIMIVSLNTATNKAFLVSVPRDLYVNIPDNGYAKINEAYQDGEQNQAGGGAALLESVLQDKLGINIDYYALINYAAFRDTVNALGGITVTINSSDRRGLYDPNIAKVDGGPLKLANGTQQLDGQTALNLARARGDSPYSYGFPGSDFDRTAHQRMMLVAVKDKAASASTLSNPVKIAGLLDALGNNVKTDMNTSEARRLYDLSKKISSTDIASATLAGTSQKPLLKSYTTRTGQSALIPTAGIDDYTDIQAYLDQLLSSH